MIDEYPSDLTESERTQLDAIVAFMNLDSSPFHYRIVRTEEGQLAQFRAVPVHKLGGPINLSDYESTTFSEMASQFRKPTTESLGGTSLSTDEMRFAVSCSVVIDVPSSEKFEVSEIVVRNKETGELAGSLVRLADGSLVYNKDAA